MERSLFEDRGVQGTPAGFLAVRDQTVFGSEHTSVSFSNCENLIFERGHWAPPAEERGPSQLLARLYRIRPAGQGRAQNESPQRLRLDSSPRSSLALGGLSS